MFYAERSDELGASSWLIKIVPEGVITNCSAALCCLQLKLFMKLKIGCRGRQQQEREIEFVRKLSPPSLFEKAADQSLTTLSVVGAVNFLFLFILTIRHDDRQSERFYVALFHLLALGCAICILVTAVRSMEISSIFYGYLSPFPLLLCWNLFYLAVLRPVLRNIKADALRQIKH